MNKCIVYLPVYNGEKFLEATLDSVMEQDYPNYQVVICDDCSSDGSTEIIASYIQKYPEKIIYLRNRRNLGVGTTLHNCYLRYHDARFFAQIGHDDVWPRNYLSSQISKLQDSNAIVSFSKNDYVDAKGKPLKFVQIFKPEKIDTLKPDAFFLTLLRGNFLCAPASVVDLSKLDKEKVTQFWGYNNERLQDCELWLNLSLRGRFIYNQDVTMHYRIHGSNLSDEEKRIMQGKLEYYTMARRVLFSPAFFDFVEEQNDPARFLGSLLDTLAQNFAYSNPLKLLVIDLCEHLLNNGYESDAIWTYLNWAYMDTGILTKCLKNGRHLPSKIMIQPKGVSKIEALQDLSELIDFCVLSDGQVADPKALCAVSEDGMEFLLNTDPYPYYFSNGQIIVFCEEKRVAECQKAYPHLLVVSEDISAQKLSKLLYQFVEDKTHVYRNGLMDMIISPSNSDASQTYHRICVKTDEQVVRAVFLPGHAPEDCIIYTGTTRIEVIPSDAAIIFLEETPVENGTLFVHCNKEIALREPIILNNVLYVCTEVITDNENQFLPIYQKLCYCSDNPTSGRLNNFQLEALYASKVIELQQITNSFSYRIMVKIKKLLKKMHLNGFVKQVMLKLYRLIKGKPFSTD